MNLQSYSLKYFIQHLKLLYNKDRLTRFGFRFIYEWLKEKQVILEVINKVDGDKEDLLQDFVSLVT